MPVRKHIRLEEKSKSPIPSKSPNLPSSPNLSLPVNQVVCGDNLEVMARMPDNCVDTIITDPPYGLGFMGKEWDTFKQDSVIAGVKSNLGNGRIGDRGRNDTSPAWVAARYDHSRNAEFQQWFTVWAKEVLRVAKPGAIMLVFGGTRTFHRLTCAIEDAGWQIRDCLSWIYGSGFPKSHNIGKAVDKMQGNKRKIVGEKQGTYADIRRDEETGQDSLHGGSKAKERPRIKLMETKGSSNWEGYGTALKPAWEPIIVAMKPLDGPFAHNAEKWGVAGLAIDKGRITPQQLGEYRGCEFCGEERYIKKCFLKRHQHHFCSAVCQQRWQQKNKATQICVVCGKEFSFPKSQKQRKTCSQQCKGVWVSFLQSQNNGLNNLELKGSEILKNIGVDFQEQVLIENKFLVDIFIPSKKVVIQWDGVYWHSKPKRKQLDISQDAYMKRCGYKVLRFTDREVYANPNMVKEEINQILNVSGRWPANLILDEEAAGMLDEQSGLKQAKPERTGKRGGKGFGFYDDEKSASLTGKWPADSGGGASRFFYCAKASRAERNVGLEGLPDQPAGFAMRDDKYTREKMGNTPAADREPVKNNHPTVKPLKLMEYLCRLTKTPSGGVVLDPFGGSGTTGIACVNMGRDYIVIEKEKSYCEIAEKRIAWARSERDAS